MTSTTSITTTTKTTEPESVVAKITYTAVPPDGVRYWVSGDIDPETGEFAGVWTKHIQDTVIENVRGKEDQYTLDKNGFQFHQAPTKHKSFNNHDEIKNEYYPESIELYKKLTGASRVVIFDHTIRRRRPDQFGQTAETRQPAVHAHIDQSTKASIARVHLHLPAEEVPGLLEKRFQIVNLWRPITHTASEWPLALCDYYTTDRENDLIPVTLRYPDREGEIIGVRYNPKQKWSYLRNMTPDEVVLIKCFDSILDGSVAVFTPHTSFEDPSSPPDAPYRESIELRALVFYD